ncbi:MAG TPA: hypothetical protein VER78_01300, partial [Thermoanaerobaculia bacterium]|nr:hypothetical protein [Thermoanaerobaculia bacterium]
VLFGLLLLRLGIINNVVNVAKSREGPHKIARRKILAAARRFFQRELASRQPKLSDDWFPYLVALELGNRVDRWFRAYGGTRTAVASSGPAAFGSSSSSSVSSGSWTGGGGSFGGAGSSGSWAIAAGALAAGVAAPGSSGGGGGGGGGGGSSGGGGGGGW